MYSKDITASYFNITFIGNIRFQHHIVRGMILWKFILHIIGEMINHWKDKLKYAITKLGGSLHWSVKHIEMSEKFMLCGTVYF